MHRYIETFKHDEKREDINIDHFPRKEKKIKAKKVKNKKQFSQSPCSHQNCHQLEQTYPNFDQSRKQRQLKFHQKTKQQQLNEINGIVEFSEPLHSKNAKKWKNNTAKHRYPRSYRIKMRSFNGMKIFIVCLLYILWFYAIGIFRWRNYLTIIWDQRSKGNTDIIYESNYKAYCNTDKEPEWEHQYEQFSITNYPLVNSHYISSDIVYFDIYNEAEQTPSD